MLRLEARPAPSRLFAWASPVISVPNSTRSAWPAT